MKEFIKDLTYSFSCLLVIVIAIMGLFLFKSCEKANNAENLYLQANDTLVKTRNDKNEEVTKRKLIFNSYAALKMLSESKDSTIRKLAAIVKKGVISGVVLNNHTDNSGTSSTVISFDKPEIKNNPDTNTKEVPIYPTYKTMWKDRWSSGVIIAKKDSIFRTFKLFNEYAISQKSQRQSGLKGFFKPNEVIVEITNSNPMTSTDDIASFAIKPEKQHKWLTFGIGAIAGAAGVMYLKR